MRGRLDHARTTRRDELTTHRAVRHRVTDRARLGAGTRKGTHPQFPAERLIFQHDGRDVMARRLRADV